MVKKFLLCPERVRRVPRQFSWVDHRLVRDGYVKRCRVPALALYLFLVTVGDVQGLSYYSDASISSHLSIDLETLNKARRQLIDAKLIAYKKPLYQVLALDCRRVAGADAEPESIGQVLSKVLGDYAL